MNEIVRESHKEHVKKITFLDFMQIFFTCIKIYVFETRKAKGIIHRWI